MSNNPNQVMAAQDGAGDFNPQLESVAKVLRQTRPWVRLISVMMFIGSAFMILSGGFMILGSLTGIRDADMEDLFGGGGEELGVKMMAIIGAVYIVMSFFYIVPAVFLWQYAQRIQTFEIERSTGTLVSALKPQKSFWRFCGILVVAYLVIVAAVMCFGIIALVVQSM